MLALLSSAMLNTLAGPKSFLDAGLQVLHLVELLLGDVRLVVVTEDLHLLLERPLLNL